MKENIIGRETEKDLLSRIYTLILSHVVSYASILTMVATSASRCIN